jgi:octaprenyl-diphosphate synthase
MTQSSQLTELLQPVAPGMERMRGILMEQVLDSSAAVRDMTGHVGRFRGKELRGALVLLTGEATGNTTDEHPAVAAIVQMIHLATLVHDDILDGAEVRRRVASVNQRWDNQIAVLLGDFLYARAFALSTTLSSRLCSRMLAETTRRLCVGEIEQSTRRYDFEMSHETYEKIVGAKTASLYAAACELGARYPGGNEELGTKAARVGWNLGVAFQIIDDCLDLTGTTQELGKSAGTDVEDGKVTLPVLHTYSHAEESVRAAIRDVYTRPGIENRAAVLWDTCDLEPGIAFAKARARELAEDALGRIEDLSDAPARAALAGVVEFVVGRQF